MINEEIRKYEISVWTLQDSFITVLKWSDVSQRGGIQKAQMTLKDDGTESLSFEIPMYLRENNRLVENPIWYNTRNGNIEEGLRKIKVVFNKKPGQIDETGIFEFLIVKVTDVHEKDCLTCKIECDGLAFHELGKIGYKIDLSANDFLVDYETWAESGTGTAPVQNLDYWCSKCGSVYDLLPWDANNALNNPQQWYYEVRMNWLSFEDGPQRVATKIYEEPYTLTWDENDQPSEIQAYKEKERPIEIKDSNLYNITQKIAETFGVHCKYEYLHDENYHIRARKVVFFNSFGLTPEDTFSLTYPHSSQKIVRTLDSTDIVTKLYITGTDDMDITSVEPNYSREDYILNFDYLHDKNIITNEQYKGIATYEKACRNYNTKLFGAQKRYNNLQDMKIKIEAKIKVLENSITACKEAIDTNDGLKQQIINTYGNGTELARDNMHPDTGVPIVKDDGKVIVSFAYNVKGILINEQFKVYKNYSAVDKTFSNEVSKSDYKIVYNEEHQVEGIELLGDTKNAVTASSNRLTLLYFAYKYNPELYYDEIVKKWKTKLAKDDSELKTLKTRLANVNTTLDRLETTIDTNIDLLIQTRKDFTLMMGPALREGYWTADTAKNRVAQKAVNLTLNNTYNPAFFINQSSKDECILGWDATLFEDEEPITYTIGIEGTVENYLYLDATNFYTSTYADIWNEENQYSVIFDNTGNVTNPTTNELADLQVGNCRIMVIGSEVEFAFIKNSSNEIKPVLVVRSSKTFPEIEVNNFKNSWFIGKYNIENDRFIVKYAPANNTRADSIHSRLDNKVKIVYPRIKIKSPLFITDGYFNIIYNNNGSKTNLEKFQDYQILSRLTEYSVSNNIYEYENYITIKPKVLMRQMATGGTFLISYSLSQVGIGTYLDAIKVAKENAYPKVSYDIQANVLNIDFIKTLYARLDELAMINDTELKLEDQFGYISEVDLVLDTPDKDSVKIKNYTGKFEDLFSTIVAQTQAMQSNSNSFNAAINGDLPLSGEGIQSTLNNNSAEFQAYLESWLKSSPFFFDTLNEAFTEAGTILAQANSSIDTLSGITAKNYNILSSFAKNISNEFTSKVYKQVEKPANFKFGDVWIQPSEEENAEDTIYVATADSSQSGTGNTAGFVKTRDGTLAQIVGAKLAIDAENGNIVMEAENNITIKAGAELDLGSVNVNITGSNSVNIGGSQINIVSSNKTENQYTGIKIMSEQISNDQHTLLSWVDILPQSIGMHSSNIRMEGGQITLLTSGSTVNSTSVIDLSAEKGIYIGSEKAISLFSGGISSNTKASSASVELSDKHLIFGFNESSNTSVVNIDKLGITIGVGKSATNASTIGNAKGLIGARFTSNSIGFATKISNIFNAILMDGKGITVASGTIDSNGNSSIDVTDTTNDFITDNVGSYVRIASNGIDIGSDGHLRLKTNSVRLWKTTNYELFALGNNIKNITFDQLNTINSINNSYMKGINNQKVNFIYNRYGLFINSNIYAQSLIANSENGQIIVSGSKLGFYATDGTTEQLLITSSGINAYKDFNIITGNNFSVSADNFVLNTKATKSNNILRIGAENSPVISYSLSNGLNIEGKITATQFIAKNGNNTVLTITGDTVSCNKNFEINTINSMVLKANNGNITLAKNRYIEVSTRPTNLTAYIPGDLVYVASEGKLYKVTSGGLTELASTETEISAKIAELLTSNSFQVTDNGVLICDTIICNKIYYKNQQNSLPSYSRTNGYVTCNDQCASSCSTACSVGCGSGCSGGCSGGCGSGCTGDCDTACRGSGEQGSSICNSSCATACNVETESSATTCADQCTGVCVINCDVWCTQSCTSCSHSCTDACQDDCQNSCYNSCTGGCNTTCNDTCTGSCNITCDVACADNGESSANQCTTECGYSCKGSCSDTCTGGCKGSCSGKCVTTCSGTNSNNYVN